jgi:hypothetical protein
MLRRIGIIAVLSLIVAAVAAVPALAVGPTSTTRDGGLHFVGQPDATATKTATSAFLTATGEVAGAGGGGTAILSSTAEVTTGCITDLTASFSEHDPHRMMHMCGLAEGYVCSDVVA